jgi:hypothetical protein
VHIVETLHPAPRLSLRRSDPLLHISRSLHPRLLQPNLLGTWLPGCIAPEVTSNTGAPPSIPNWPPSAIPVKLPFDSTSLALFALASGYDPESVHNTRSALPSDLSKLNQEFRQSLAGGLRDNTMGSFSVHVNHYRQLCEARNLPALPLTYERIAEY